MKPRHPLRDRARALRNSATEAERFLWRYLRRGQLDGIKFRRQQPVERYIVDFVAFSPRVVVELDGGQHADCASDGERDACLTRNGFRVLRFWNHEVFGNIEGVLEVIRLCCAERAPPGE